MKKLGMRIILICLATCLVASVANVQASQPAKLPVRSQMLIVTSDTLLASMVSDLLPVGRYKVEALMPPGQCPGHYDLKLSDIAEIGRAQLVIGLRGIPMMNKACMQGRNQVTIDAGSRNWMAPASYALGLDKVAEALIARFPQERESIMLNKQKTVKRVDAAAKAQRARLTAAGLRNRAVIASQMQQEPLEWMGLRVLATYGRPEAISAKEVVRLTRIGRESGIVAVVDNLQSGPDTGKSIAESLKTAHVVWSNFPSEQGYLATLKANADAIISAAGSTK